MTCLRRSMQGAIPASTISTSQSQARETPRIRDATRTPAKVGGFLVAGMAFSPNLPRGNGAAVKRGDQMATYQHIGSPTVFTPRAPGGHWTARVAPQRLRSAPASLEESTETGPEPALRARLSARASPQASSPEAIDTH